MKTFFKKISLISVALPALTAFSMVAYAAHSWGGYHWGRTANPFTLKLGDNVSTVWDGYLTEASADWSISSVLDTPVVAGGAGNPQRCRATGGRIEVCNSKYGSNGWLGVASIWASGGHITQGTVKMNDTYFSTAKYNKPEWRRTVMCQEIGHTLGLDHQDEDFSNPNLGTCMDYSSNPLGLPSNEHPNAHDYEQLEAIYSHLDAVTTVSQSVAAKAGSDADGADWGKGNRKDSRNHTSIYERDLGNGQKQITFVLWAE